MRTAAVARGRRIGESDEYSNAKLQNVRRTSTAHYHGERNHQGKNNVLLFLCARAQEARFDTSVACRARLGGLLKYYHREAA